MEAEEWLHSQCFMPGLKEHWRDFSGGPVALCFHCRGHGFDPWVEN